MPSLEIEETHGWPRQRVVGVDEAGRGAWMGPVYAAAVFLPAGFDFEGLDDSKRLSQKQRGQQFERITQGAICGIGTASVAEIDRLNILQATFLAMQRAVAATQADFALIDGNRPPALACPLKCVIGGDRLSASIAAASILAKISRDRHISALAAEYPVYAWQKNKGYGTKDHRLALDQHGVSPHHRRSFAPMRDMSSL